MTAPLFPLGLDELLTITRTVRKRLDFSRPVSREMIEECIDIAIQAPNGLNQQMWGWVVIDDPQRKSEVAEVYRAGMQVQIENMGWMKNIDYSANDQQRIARSVEYLASRMHAVPAIVIPVINGKLDGTDLHTQASLWGSILLATWNFF